MYIKHLRGKLLLIALLPFSILLTNLAAKYPQKLEYFYSNGINKYIREYLSIFFGVFPFSFAQLIVTLFVVFCLYYIFKTIKILIFKSNKLKTLVDFILSIMIVISIIYFSFLLSWGLNYERLPFATINHLKVSRASVTALENLCKKLIITTNGLRSKITENSLGVMYLPSGKNSVFSQVSNVFKASSKIYPELSGNYGRPKSVFLSQIMSYAGISGIYFPLTGEPNVNIDMPFSMIPSTACHEAAHQHGFAREDEANFIAYLVCYNSSNIAFEYSGNLLALIYSMNALYNMDVAKYDLLKSTYSPGLNRDLDENNAYWNKFEGPIEKISNKINNSYLKANKQKNGVYSYGGMVDLLIAEFKSK